MGTTTMSGLVTAASTTFTTTTGFDIGSVVTWMATNLLDPVIGAGLLLLTSVWGWILALILLAAIVYFVYRGFRFFHH